MEKTTSSDQPERRRGSAELPSWDVLRNLPNIQEPSYIDAGGKSTKQDGTSLKWKDARQIKRGDRTSADTEIALVGGITNSQWYKQKTADTHLLLDSDRRFHRKFFDYVSGLVEIGREIDKRRPLETYSKYSAHGLYDAFSGSSESRLSGETAFNKKLRGIQNLIEKHLEEKLNDLEQKYKEGDESYHTTFGNDLSNALRVHPVEYTKDYTTYVRLFVDQWNKLVKQRNLPLIDHKSYDGSIPPWGAP